MYENFTGESINYSLEKYNFPQWALSRIKQKYPDVTSLETIHKEVDVSELNALQHWVSSGCSTIEFMEMLDNFLSENISPLTDKEFLIQRFGTLRVVIPQQEKVGRLLSYHQGIFVGNGTGLRTVWTPFTRCWGTNTMHMLNLAVSRDITKRVIEEQWDQVFFNNFSEKHSYSIDLEPGQSWLFNQELIHGNVNNDTDITRVSMDLRIMLKGDNYGRKYPGQYFRTLFDWRTSTKEFIYDETESFITYAGWNSEYTKHIPLNLQRAFMKEYTDQYGIIINDYQFENEYLDHLPNLMYLSSTVDNIVMLSIYALPDSSEARYKIYDKFLEESCNLHFAQEDIVLNDKGTVDIIENYLNWGRSYKDWNINT